MASGFLSRKQRESSGDPESVTPASAARRSHYANNVDESRGGEEGGDSLIGLLQCVEIGERLPKDVDHLVDLGAVEAELGVAVGHPVDGLVFLEALTLEAKAFGQLFDFGEEDEVDVFFAEVAFALRAVDRAILGRLDQFEYELSLALRALEDLG